MQFTYPTFLFALFALAIPIIIHLFYFRRFKKVYFTNIRFLKEVKEETSARRKLRNLLVLLMRCLALAFLVFAFAQPFIPQEVDVKTGEKAVSIFIDNSFSMSSLSQDVPLLQQAKRRAGEIVNAHSVEDRFQVLTNDFEGRHQRLVGKEDALSLIDEITISPSVKELSKVLTRQNQALNSDNAENKTSYVISDFQKNVTDIETYLDTTIQMNLVPLQSVQEKNIAIDSAWFEAPVQMVNQTNLLRVKVRNLSAEPVENIRLSIQYEGQTKPVGTLTIPAQSSVIDTVPITILRTGWHKAKLEITDYPVQFDDKYFLSFKVAEAINVLIVNELSPNNYLKAAFEGIPYFKVTNQNSNNLDYSKFSNYQMIVSNELVSLSSGLAFELKKYAENGGNLLVFPAQNANVGAYKNFLSSFPANELINFENQERFVGDINTEEFVFKDVFDNKSSNLKLPVTQGNYKMSNFASRGEERLLTYRDGNPFLSKYGIGQGNLYLCSAPLNLTFNNLVRSGEIFIPMLYKMAISSSKENRIAYTIGKDESIITDNFSQGNETVYKLKGSTEEFIPEQRTVGSKVYLGIHNKVREAGYYELFLNPDDVLAEYAFNYDRKESELDYFNEEDLTKIAGNRMSVIGLTSSASFENLIEERSQGVVLCRWCFILGLLLLL
ncbi:MAG: BatA domain-containing protein, partial [Saprospiraceae bacterium]|nr:BatA domain-containing protein [Saprospiraceae bacterium]